PQVTATRSATLVCGAQIFAAVREQIVSQARLSGRFEVEPLRLPRDQIVPAGRLEIRVGRPGATVRKGANTIPVSLFVDGRLYSTVNISVNVRVFAPVLVTTTAVPRGAELTDANTRLEDREVTLLGENLVSPPLEPGLTAALALQEGEILRTSHVRSRPAIRSGDSVTVLVTAGPVRLSERGAAAQDGRVGERIKVRLAGEVREVRGIVRTSGLVHIDLNGKDSCDAQTL
ncbi:MAG: flagellar basal body P-ring formation chaperone FlgA, partial [Armatimonadota bacterium]